MAVAPCGEFRYPAANAWGDEQLSLQGIGGSVNDRFKRKKAIQVRTHSLVTPLEFRS